MTFRAASARVVLSTLVLWSAAPSSGKAQTTPGDVPMDLVVSLLGGQGRGLRIFVGGLPPEVEGRVPLGDVERVVGGIVHGEGGTVVVEVAGSPAEVLSAYRSHLEAEGWERPAVSRGGQGGFLSSREFDWSTWCGEGLSIASSSLSFDARTYLSVRYRSRDRGNAVCDIDADGRADVFGELRFPDLEPPPDAAVRPGGRGASSDHVDMQATVESSLTSDVIFQHYAEQLTTAGWLPEGQTKAGDVSIGRWRTQDADGDPVVGVLAVWTLTDPDLHVAWARMDRTARRP